MKILCILLLCVSAGPGLGQGVFSNQTSAALQRVISDYPNQFQNIKGEKIGSRADATEFRSTVDIAGAAGVVITAFREGDSHEFSWQTILFQSSNFADTKQRFQEYFQSIKNSIIRVEGLPPVILNGNYDSPREDQNQTIIPFQLLPANNKLKGLLVALKMVQENGVWEIHLTAGTR